MIRKSLSVLLALVMLLCAGSALASCQDKNSDFKVGFIFLHDENSTYDLNFINAANETCEALGFKKTQFIFKINKGVESVFDSKLVNQYIEEDKRPVPFRRMIYVGDGTTDIPCMRLVKNSGGHSIAVYNPEIRNARRELNGLIRDNRVSHVCPADYSEGSEMDTLVKTIIDKIEADHRLELLETPRT